LGYDRCLALLTFGVSSVPRERCLVPRIAAAGAIGDILALVAKRIVEFGIRATVHIDHALDLLTRSMHE
jgi:hypothetical protein